MRAFAFFCKRILRLCPAVLGITLALLCVLLCAAVTLTAQTEESSRLKLSVGVVGNTKQAYLQPALFALEHLDDSRFYVEFLPLSREEAEEGIRSGELHAFVEIPDGFVDALLKRDPVPLSFVAPANTSAAQSVLLSEICDVVGELVAHTQKGIYGMQNYAHSSGKADGELWKKTDLLSLRYVDFILHRNGTLRLSLVGHSDESSFLEYYACAAVMFVLLMWGITCFGILHKKDGSLQMILALRGKGGVLAEYGAFFLFSCLFFFAVSLSVPLLIPEGNALLFFVALLPSLFALTAMDFFCCELFSPGPSFLLSRFVFALFAGYLSGCFYPLWFFPASLQTFSAFLPSGAGMSLLRRSFHGGELLFPGAVCLLWGLLFLGGSLLLRKRNLLR